MSIQTKLKVNVFEKCLTACELQGRRSRLTIDRLEVQETTPLQGVTENCPSALLSGDQAADKHLKI